MTDDDDGMAEEARAPNMFSSLQLMVSVDRVHG